jgi:hypothetical protein
MEKRRNLPCSRISDNICKYFYLKKIEKYWLLKCGLSSKTHKGLKEKTDIYLSQMIKVNITSDKSYLYHMFLNLCDKRAP